MGKGLHGVNKIFREIVVNPLVIGRGKKFGREYVEEREKEGAKEREMERARGRERERKRERERERKKEREKK